MNFITFWIISIVSSIGIKAIPKINLLKSVNDNNLKYNGKVLKVLKNEIEPRRKFYTSLIPGINLINSGIYNLKYFKKKDGIISSCERQNILPKKEELPMMQNISTQKKDEVKKNKTYSLTLTNPKTNEKSKVYMEYDINSNTIRIKKCIGPYSNLSEKEILLILRKCFLKARNYTNNLNYIKRLNSSDIIDERNTGQKLVRSI